MASDRPNLLVTRAPTVNYTPHVVSFACCRPRADAELRDLGLAAAHRDHNLYRLEWLGFAPRLLYRRAYSAYAPSLALVGVSVRPLLSFSCET